MNTSQNELTIDSALSGVPQSFRGKLVDRYRALKAAYSNGQPDACGLRVGQFCEVMLRLLQDRLTSNHVPFGTKIQNFDRECQKLEQTSQDAGPESMCVIMPRAIAFLYTLRNKRGIGHIGGDVDANAIDAATMVRLADWCLCELIRIVHNLALEDAQVLLDAITERQLPAVWSVVGKKRVLDPSLDRRSQTLLLLYNDVETAVPAEDLCDWIECSTLANYRRDVLRPLHTQRLIEFDAGTDMVLISPTGIVRVEMEVLQKTEPSARTPVRAVGASSTPRGAR